MKRDLISILDVKDDIHSILTQAVELKKQQKQGKMNEILRNKTLALIFEKSSTRTRISFEVGMTQLGGQAMYLNVRDLQLGRGETIADTAKVLSRYVDGVVYRAFEHKKMIELATHSTIPVINGLDDMEHPCQVLADLLTIKEFKGDFRKLKMAYLGDGNNVCNSLLLGAAMVGMNIGAACPENFEPNAAIIKNAQRIAEKNDSRIEIGRSAKSIVKDADIIYTDVWVSMGDEKEKKMREKAFAPYQVNDDLVKHAKEDCIIMHCLPAHRGYEITGEIIDGKHSVVFDQAENRLHAQKAILVKLLV
jgi:ornithine carbamoyltransferase